MHLSLPFYKQYSGVIHLLIFMIFMKNNKLLLEDMGGYGVTDGLPCKLSPPKVNDATF